MFRGLFLIQLKLMAGLPINLDDLLYARGVEDVRRELKAGWDEFTAESAVRTICAFANDIYNLNGGYLIIGVQEDDLHRAILPPKGVDEQDIARILKQVEGQCNRIEPAYHPAIAVEKFQGRSIIVVWCPAGVSRPYRAPARRDAGDRKHFVRFGAETVEATGETERQLIELTARVPYDDRPNYSATINDISPSLVRRHLARIGSSLAAGFDGVPAEQIYRQCGLTSPVNGHEAPRNVALLFFNEEPHRFFRGAVTEVTEFPSGPAGNDLREQYFKGPLPEQLRQTLEHLKVFNQTILRKRDYKSEVDHIIGYPEEALAEALANSYYHRSYDVDCVDPTVVEIHPDRIEITSYPGPVLGITREWLNSPDRRTRVTARNRRIGEHFKELKLAEQRFTGIPKIISKMEQNGSPRPEFEFDDARTYFKVTLRAHPEFQLAYAFQEADRLETAGDNEEALQVLLEAQKRLPASPELLHKVMSLAGTKTEPRLLLGAYERFKTAMPHAQAADIGVGLAIRLAEGGDSLAAMSLLQSIPQSDLASVASGAARAFSQVGLYEEALRYRQIAAEREPENPFLFWNWAIEAHVAARSADPEIASELSRQAEELALKVIGFADGKVTDWMKGKLWTLVANTRKLRNAGAESVTEALQFASNYAVEDESH